MGGDHPCEKAVKVGVSGGQLTPGLTNSKACPSVEETQLATHTCVVEEQR
jgi:hypothetical protein